MSNTVQILIKCSIFFLPNEGVINKFSLGLGISHSLSFLLVLNISVNLNMQGVCFYKGIPLICLNFVHKVCRQSSPLNILNQMTKLNFKVKICVPSVIPLLGLSCQLLHGEVERMG